MLKPGETGVTGVDGSGTRDRQEVLASGRSFGGGIGGVCLEEPAANLNTLREAKREEDDEADCFWPDPELVVVAIVWRGMEGVDVPRAAWTGVAREA